MASAWGSSWGTSWGNSWGDAGAVVEPVQPGQGGGVGYAPQRRHPGDVTAYGEILDVYVSLIPGDANATTNVTVAASVQLYARAELICGDATGEDNLEDDEVIALILAEAA